MWCALNILYMQRPIYLRGSRPTYRTTIQICKALSVGLVQPSTRRNAGGVYPGGSTAGCIAASCSAYCRSLPAGMYYVRVLVPPRQMKKKENTRPYQERQPQSPSTFSGYWSSSGIPSASATTWFSFTC